MKASTKTALAGLLDALDEAEGYGKDDPGPDYKSAREWGIEWGMGGRGANFRLRDAMDAGFVKQATRRTRDATGRRRVTPVYKITLPKPKGRR